MSKILFPGARPGDPDKLDAAAVLTGLLVESGMRPPAAALAVACIQAIANTDGMVAWGWTVPPGTEGLAERLNASRPLPRGDDGGAS